MAFPHHMCRQIGPWATVCFDVERNLVWGVWYMLDVVIVCGVHVECAMYKWVCLCVCMHMCIEIRTCLLQCVSGFVWCAQIVLFCEGACLHACVCGLGSYIGIWFLLAVTFWEGSHDCSCGCMLCKLAALADSPTPCVGPYKAH